MKIVSIDEVQAEGVSHNPAIRKRVLLRDGQVEHLAMFSQATFEPGQVAIAHRHTGMYEVFFVRDGEGEIHVDGRVCALRPGVCAVVEPGESHEVRNTGVSQLVLIYFGIKR